MHAPASVACGCGCHVNCAVCKARWEGPGVCAQGPMSHRLVCDNFVCGVVALGRQVGGLRVGREEQGNQQSAGVGRR